MSPSDDFRPGHASTSPQILPAVSSDRRSRRRLAFEPRQGSPIPPLGEPTHEEEFPMVTDLDQVIVQTGECACHSVHIVHIHHRNFPEIWAECGTAAEGPPTCPASWPASWKGPATTGTASPSGRPSPTSRPTSMHWVVSAKGRRSRSNIRCPRPDGPGIPTRASRQDVPADLRRARFPPRAAPRTADPGAGPGRYREIARRGAFGLRDESIQHF